MNEDSCLWQGIEYADNSAWLYVVSCNRKHLKVTPDDDINHILSDTKPVCPYCNRQIELEKYDD